MEVLKETKFGSGDEDDAQTLNTRIAQRKHAIPYSMIKNNRNIIECCNNTHQGVPHTDKQMSTCTSDLSDASHMLLVLSSNGICKKAKCGSSMRRH